MYAMHSGRKIKEYKPESSYKKGCLAHSIEGDLSGVDDAAGIEQEAREVFGAEQFARERRISVIFRDAKRELQEG